MLKSVLKTTMYRVGALICVLLCDSAATFVTGFRSKVCEASTPVGKDIRFFDQRPQGKISPTVLGMQQFDISKPVFDLYAFRSIRGDALTKYNSLNQSEPLRINLSALCCLIFLSLPTLTSEVNGVPLTLPQTGISVLVAIVSAASFVRECQKRSRQLTRMEKELFALDLQVRPPASLLADRPFGDAVSIRSIQEYGGGPRILALYSETADTMERVLNDLRVIGKRLVQAEVLVVPIIKQGKIPSERNEWLATAEYPKEWMEYFQSLASEEDALFKWFGLSSTGRSFGSGAGEPPSWLQLMGQHLRPLDIVDPEDSVDSTMGTEDSKAILQLQRQFYDALTNGKLEQLESVFANDTTKEVTDVLAQGGRLDSWKFCLEDDARPKGMKVGNTDVTVESTTCVFSTAIEFPVTDGLADARLLALQEWKRADTDHEWKLVKHQTIPWSVDVPAAGTLICDCRGCVSLVRGNQRKRFGG